MKARHDNWSGRGAVLSRLLAALLGGYALSALLTAVLALHLPLERSEAMLVGTMLSFLVYALAVMWAFAARHALRAWTGLLAPILLLAVILAAPGWVGAA
ncbi:MAG TPA: hypothetical protein VGE22_21775 [Solimonas sp.]